MEEEPLQPQPPEQDDGSTPVPNLPDVPAPSMDTPQGSSAMDPVESALAEAGVQIHETQPPVQPKPQTETPTSSNPVEAVLSEAGVPIHEASTEEFDDPTTSGRKGRSGEPKTITFGDAFPDADKPVEVRDFDTLLAEVRGIASSLRQLTTLLMNKP